MIPCPSSSFTTGAWIMVVPHGKAYCRTCVPLWDCACPKQACTATYALCPPSPLQTSHSNRTMLPSNLRPPLQLLLLLGGLLLPHPPIQPPSSHHSVVLLSPAIPHPSPANPPFSSPPSWGPPASSSPSHTSFKPPHSPLIPAPSPKDPPPSSPPSWGPPPSSWPVSAGRPQRQSRCCEAKSHRSSSRQGGVRQADMQRLTSKGSGIRRGK